MRDNIKTSVCRLGGWFFVGGAADLLHFTSFCSILDLLLVGNYFFICASFGFLASMALMEDGSGIA